MLVIFPPLSEGLATCIKFGLVVLVADENEGGRLGIYDRMGRWPGFDGNAQKSPWAKLSRVEVVPGRERRLWPWSPAFATPASARISEIYRPRRDTFVGFPYAGRRGKLRIEWFIVQPQHPA
jgi:hypothetical protein